MEYTKGEWKADGHFILAGPEIIAQMVESGENRNGIIIDSHANANLIAAAPILYEALNDLLCWVNAILSHGLAEHGIIINNPPVAKSVKALAKAEGEK